VRLTDRVRKAKSSIEKVSRDTRECRRGRHVRLTDGVRVGDGELLA